MNRVFVYVSSRGPVVLSMRGALDQRQDAAADFGAQQVAQVKVGVVEALLEF